MDFARCCERVNSNMIKPKWEDTGGKLMILEKIQDAASVKDLNPGIFNRENQLYRRASGLEPGRGGTDHCPVSGL